MNKWTSPVSFCLAFFTLVCAAQENATALKLEKVSTYVMDPEKSILTNAERSPRHHTLLAALKASDLDEVLEYDGEFTVFAPSDVAFSKLSKITIKHLLDPKNKKKLKAIMSYHIVAGKLSASTILRNMCRGNGKTTFTTVHGETLTATMNGIDIILTDSKGNKARITTADSNQSNGVIHEIDKVFFPTSI
ncbi:fasciclin domain-containing protein [Maribacter sp. 2210JD10-5]|uniref:fasciclin domain-containing protein n=1 Tax=Maribacter sp. 2210JD10-5 TaxID=3386272 RepID=UPI0039BCC0B6